MAGAKFYTWMLFLSTTPFSNLLQHTQVTLALLFDVLRPKCKYCSNIYNHNVWKIISPIFFGKTMCNHNTQNNYLVQQVYTRCWKGSMHVSHYLKHRKDYEAEVLAFLERIGLTEPTRHRATSLWEFDSYLAPYLHRITNNTPVSSTKKWGIPRCG